MRLFSWWFAQPSPDEPWGGLGNRTLAMVLDLGLVIFLFSWLPLNDAWRPYALPLIAFAYFALLPISPLEGTPGKWACRVRMVAQTGQRLSLRQSVIRALGPVLWFCIPVVLRKLPPLGPWSGTDLSILWWWLWALPWSTAWFLPYRATLFDRLAGTVVIRRTGRWPDETTANWSIRPYQVVLALLLALLAGAILHVAIRAMHDFEMRSRVAYAVSQTSELRLQMANFHYDSHRWPTPAELGRPAATPYPGGGHYRMEPRGQIVIQFAVLQELKGKTLRFSPRFGTDGLVEWRCERDSALPERYVPGQCRH